ncbi:MAG: preprotein translocase subunit SecG [Patescibacteria group bacterium]|nr:MAG: preprotein translocase subunit SecG [Patescibacteria group bacterium]
MLDPLLIQVFQIVISILLVAVILMQNRGAGAGGIFGASDAVYRTKRGAEKILFRATIVLGILFFAVSATRLFA